MGKSDSKFSWIDRIAFEGRPAYAAILAPLEDAIRSGELQSGDRLPAQRQLADKLNVDLTLVTRAYSAARARGLIEGTVGRGTFVRTQTGAGRTALVDLSHANPPAVPGLSLATLIAETTAAVLKGADLAAFMGYQSYHWASSENAAAARWLEPLIGPIAGDRVLITPGAQAGLAAVLSGLCQPGEAIVADPLTHSGFIWLARQFGLRTIACPGDAQGMRPDALARICETERPTALYVIPTGQNPTAVTMPLERRREIAKVAAAADLWVIEADPLSALSEAPAPALASLAPERTFYLATLSKLVGAGMRLGFLAPPEAALMRMSDSVKTLAFGPSRLTSAIFTRWVEDGTAGALLAGVRDEVRARRQIAERILPQAKGGPDALFLWTSLPSRRVSERLVLLAREHGVSVLNDEGYALAEGASAGVRLALGAAPDRASLERALKTVGDLIPKATPSAIPLVL